MFSAYCTGVVEVGYGRERRQREFVTEKVTAERSTGHGVNMVWWWWWWWCLCLCLCLCSGLIAERDELLLMLTYTPRAHGGLPTFIRLDSFRAALSIRSHCNDGLIS